jgi:hypothetical protein
MKNLKLELNLYISYEPSFIFGCFSLLTVIGMMYVLLFDGVRVEDGYIPGPHKGENFARGPWQLPLEREMCPWAISKYFGD